ERDRRPRGGDRLRSLPRRTAGAMIRLRDLLFFAIAVSTACDFGTDKTSSTAQAIGRCKEKRGDVRAHPATLATWSPLAIDAELGQGDWVQTAADAFAKIELFSGSTLEIEPSSVVVLEEEGEGETKERIVGLVAVQSGRVRGV